MKKLIPLIILTLALTVSAKGGKPQPPPATIEVSCVVCDTRIVSFTGTGYTPTYCISIAIFDAVTGAFITNAGCFDYVDADGSIAFNASIPWLPAGSYLFTISERPNDGKPNPKAPVVRASIEIEFL